MCAHTRNTTVRLMIGRSSRSGQLEFVSDVEDEKYSHYT